jgi:hypothetical protein
MKERDKMLDKQTAHGTRWDAVALAAAAVLMLVILMMRA